MLDHNNIKFFKDTVQKIKKDTQKEISACCPLCGDTKFRLHLVNVPSDSYDYVRCFNEGCQVESPTSVYRYLQLAGGDISAYKRVNLKDKIDQIKNEKSLQDILDEVKARKAPKTLDKEIPKLLLDKFIKCSDSAECLEYLSNRNIEPHNDWLFSKDKFFTFNDKSLYVENYIIIPIHNENMKFKGFYSRSITEKRFSTFLLPDTEKIWLLDPTKPPKYIFEGIFDAISSGFTEIGAMIGADVSEEYRNNLSKDTVFCFDNDATGTAKSIKYAKLGFNVLVWPENGYKDTNEMLKDYDKTDVKRMIQNNIFRGIQAETRLRMKPK